MKIEPLRDLFIRPLVGVTGIILIGIYTKAPTVSVVERVIMVTIGLCAMFIAIFPDTTLNFIEKYVEI